MTVYANMAYGLKMRGRPLLSGAKLCARAQRNKFCFSKALLLFESKTGVNLFDTVLVHGYAQPSFLYGPWWGNALDLALFAVVLVFSYGTYRLVEKPANTWFRDYAQLGPPILSKDKAAAF